ncbi:MAG: N-6 DNA methylase [Myxococcaceae bacterium]
MEPRRSTTLIEVDEEGLSSHVSPEQRSERGVFFTPAAVVEAVLERVAPFVPARGRVRIIDPACGAGAFLTAAARRWPRAEVVGVELDARSAAICRGRLPKAKIVVGNALTDEVLPPPDGAFELWVGNPPWNGTSPLLRDKAAWERACSWLPDGVELKRGTSLRDDFVFFLLLASTRLARRGAGALAFVTPATLLDAFAHAPVRAALSSRMSLRSVEVLARGTFAGTRVEPSVTVWTAGAGEDEVVSRGEERSWRPTGDAAAQLDAEWRARGGVPISALVPVSFAGLKTRFDELLVDDDREVLAKRVKRFLSGKDPGLGAHFSSKVGALREFAGAGVRFDERCLRPFLRYRGPQPMGKDAWCYLERRLIPRGDHRQRGEFDPHSSRLKLVFNVHELPLAAHVIERDGCVTMYRHSRFAPEMVPRGLLRDSHARDFDARDLVPNVTPLGARFGSVRAVFERIAAHVMSREFQEVWAPAFGASRAPIIPID